MTDPSIRRFYRMVLLVAITSLFPFSEVLCAQSSGTIQVLEPSAWATSTPRGLAVVERSSVRVTGFVDHPSGIRSVFLNGQKAAIQRESGTRARFVGFVPVEDTSAEMVIELEPVAGVVVSRTFPFRVIASPPGLVVRRREATAFERKRWAVVIGVSDYQDPNIPDLKFADDDAQAVYDFLLSPSSGMGGFDEDNVLLLLNEEATYSAIRNALFTFLKGPTDDDIVIVYFAGHGAPDPDRPQNYYLLTYDTRLEDVSSTAFPMGDVQAAIQQTFFHHFILFADACHSAGVSGQTATRSLGMNAINQVFLERLEASRGGYVALTASEVNQYSQEDTRWGGGHGVFTHYLLEALRGAADVDGDQIVTLGETTEYVRDRVRRDTRNAQIPSVSSTSFDRYLPLSVVSAPATVVADPVAVLEVVPPTPAVVELDASDVMAVDARTLFSPAQAAVKSFLIPGLGQVSTGRAGPGLGFMTGFAGALGIGLLITATDIECASPNPQSCPAGDVISEVRSRPYLGIGVGAALAVSVIAAWDAHRGAVRANQRGVPPRRASDTSSLSLGIGPRLTASSGGGVSLEWIRVRF